VVGTLATTVHDHLETGYAIFQLDAHAQTFQNFRRSLAQDSHRIFAVDFITWMHHSVGQPAVIGKQQQAAGIEVQATDGNPASALQPGQLGKYAGATVRVVPGNNLTLRLVINEHTRQAQHEFELRQLAIDPDLVFRTNALTHMRRYAVDTHAPCHDPLFEFASRAVTGIGQSLVQLWGIDERRILAPSRLRRGRRTATATPGITLGLRRALREAKRTRLARQGAATALR
jgi:hypothetical protein